MRTHRIGGGAAALLCTIFLAAGPPASAAAENPKDAIRSAPSDSRTR